MGVGVGKKEKREVDERITRFFCFTEGEKERCAKEKGGR